MKQTLHCSLKLFVVLLFVIMFFPKQIVKAQTLWEAESTTNVVENFGNYTNTWSSKSDASLSDGIGRKAGGNQSCSGTTSMRGRYITIASLGLSDGIYDITLGYADLTSSGSGGIWFYVGPESNATGITEPPTDPGGMDIADFISMPGSVANGNLTKSYLSVALSATDAIYMFVCSESSTDNAIIDYIEFAAAGPNTDPEFDDTDDVFAFAVNENVAGGTIVGVAGPVTDPEVPGSQALVWSITAGNVAGKFVINSSTGEITVNGSLNYETTNSYALTVQVSDGNTTDVATVNITINDLAEAPNTAPEFDDADDVFSFSVNESVPNGTAAGTVGPVTDADVPATQTLTWSITAGNVAGKFTINSSSGEITVSSSLDYETTPSYALTVEVSDGNGGMDVATVNININDLSETPPVDECASIGWANYNNTTFVGPVTGGGSASPVTVSTFAALEAEAEASGPRVIYVANVAGGIGSGSGSGGSRIDVKSDKTIIGLPGAVVKINFHLNNVSNIIIRNLIFQGPGAQDVDGTDNLNIQGTSNRIWVDHCDFRDGQDGNFDIKNEATNISVTWCIFQYTSVTDDLGALNHSFSNLIGADDDHTEGIGKLKVTFQYNHWKGVVERMPRVRFGQVHVINNLYTEVPGFQASKTGVTAGQDADVRVEKNAFYGIDDPIDLSKLAGSAKIQSISNLFSSCTGNQTGSGTAFTPPYTLSTIDAADVEATVLPCVGATLPAPSPDVTCPCGNSELPVTLISFTVQSGIENHFLKWELADTETLEGIVIELSTDGESFESLIELDQYAHSYSISSASLPGNGIEVYARLKFVEEDGSFSYSPVRVIGQFENLKVYPNPFTKEISIEGLNKSTVVIFTIEGIKVFESSITGSGSIDLGHLASGTYFITVIDSLTNEIKRLPLIKL